EIAHGVVGHDQIGPAVVVDVTHRYAKGLARRPLRCVGAVPVRRVDLDSRLGRHIFKVLAVDVAVQGALGAAKRRRGAVGAAQTPWGQKSLPGSTAGDHWM